MDGNFYGKLAWATTLAIALATTLSLNGSHAIAQDPVDDPSITDTGADDLWQGRRFERLADRLDLTAEQQEAIASLRDQTHSQTLELRKQLARLKNELEGAMLADEIDHGKVLGLVEKIGDTRTELQVNRAKLRLQIGEQLTPEQRDQMLMLRQHHRGHRPRGDRHRGHRTGYRDHRDHDEGSGPHGRTDASCDGNGPHGRAIRS